MTLPDERYRAITNARNFLRSLLDPKATPRIPKSIRKEAYYVLKHFPTDLDLDMLLEGKEVIKKPISDLIRYAADLVIDDNSDCKKVIK